MSVKNSLNKTSIIVSTFIFVSLILLSGCQRSKYPTARVGEPSGEGAPSYQAEPNNAPAIKTR